MDLIDLSIHSSSRSKYLIGAEGDKKIYHIDFKNEPLVMIEKFSDSTYNVMWYSEKSPKEFIQILIPLLTEKKYLDAKVQFNGLERKENKIVDIINDEILLRKNINNVVIGKKSYILVETDVCDYSWIDYDSHNLISVVNPKKKFSKEITYLLRKSHSMNLGCFELDKIMDNFLEEIVK